MKQLNEAKRMQRLAGILNESFNKGIEDIALAHSNSEPNTPPGATVGTIPQQNNEEIDDQENEYSAYAERAYDLAGDSIKNAFDILFDDGYEAEDIAEFCGRLAREMELNSTK